MIILNQGERRIPSPMMAPWAGMVFDCPGCGARVEIEAHDTFHTAGPSKFVRCPGRMDGGVKPCDELIYFKENPTRIVSFRGISIGRPAIGIKRPAEQNEAISTLITRAIHEIENLQQKLASGEQEGWEGSKRRLELKARLEEAASQFATSSTQT